MSFLSLWRCTRVSSDTIRVLFRSSAFFLGCFGFCFWVPLYTFCVLKGVFAFSLGCWFRFPMYT
jgi:hypothetical protein